MKETYDEQTKNDLIKYRIERAHEAIAESRLLAGEGYYNGAVNRLYYACFYAALALFVRNGIHAVTHAGVKSMLGLHFILKKKLATEHGVTFNTLFEKRHSGDYDDFMCNDLDMVNELLPRADAFIAVVEDLLNEND